MDTLQRIKAETAAELAFGWHMQDRAFLAHMSHRFDKRYVKIGIHVISSYVAYVDALETLIGTPGIV